MEKTKMDAKLQQLLLDDNFDIDKFLEGMSTEEAVEILNSILPDEGRTLQELEELEKEKLKEQEVDKGRVEVNIEEEHTTINNIVSEPETNSNDSAVYGNGMEPTRSTKIGKIKIKDVEYNGIRTGVISRFYKLPNVFDIQRTYIAEKCEFFGFDAWGYAFLRYIDKTTEMLYRGMLEDMIDHYENNDEGMIPLSGLYDDDGGMYFKVGEILVAKVAHAIEKDTNRFVRCQVIKIFEKTIQVLINDIDDQHTYKIKWNDLYPITNEFYAIPLFSLRCVMKDLRKFMGTKLLSDISLGVFQMDDKDLPISAEIVGRDRDGLPVVVIYITEGETERQSYSFNDEILNIITDWNRPQLYFSAGMILENAKITYVTPDGFIWIQFQSEIMNFIMKMQPNQSLEKTRLSDCLNLVRAQREKDVFNFMVRHEGNEFRRVTIMGSIGQPRSDVMDVLPHSDGRDQRAAQRREQLVVVDYTDYGYKELIPLNNLLPSTYFDEIYTQIAPQSMQIVLLSQRPGEMLLSNDDMERLLYYKAAIEVQSIEFDPMVPTGIVHFIDDKSCTRTLRSPATPNNTPKRKRSKLLVKTTDKISTVKHRFPIQEDKKRLAGYNFGFHSNSEEFIAKFSSSSHISMLKELCMCSDVKKIDNDNENHFYELIKL